MIRCQELVPDYYIEQSRDFQILCRIYDYTFNSLKYNIDTMQSLTNTKLVKDTVLPLVGDKFGIYGKQAYTNRELLTALPSAIHYKGSLKSVKILLNAYLDSLNIFDYAVAYHTKDKQSAQEISEILRMDIKEYTIVIVLSTSPRLVDLSVLDEYLKMVLPCGMLVKYVFGITETILDKFKYSENVFLFFNKTSIASQVINKDSRFMYSANKNIYSDRYGIGKTDGIAFDYDSHLTENSTEDEKKNLAFINKALNSVELNAVGNAIVAKNKVINNSEEKNE